MLPIRNKFYESFLVIHIALVILVLIGCWYHLVPHFGHAYGYEVWLYIAFAFWSADRLARLVRVAYYNHMGGSRAIVEAIPDCDIMQITVFPRVAWNFGPEQHSFLYLPGLGKFWESHPFSIASWGRQGQRSRTASATAFLSDSNSNGEEVKGSGIASQGSDLESQPNPTAKKQQTKLSAPMRVQDSTYIQFLIRPHSGTTSALRRRLLSSPSGSTMEMAVYTEGPYAGHRATLQPLSTADTVVCLVGGIGITNVLGFVEEYMTASFHGGEDSGKRRGTMRKAKRFILAWSAREMALIKHVKKSFLDQTDNAGGIECSFWCTEPSYTTAQKLDSYDDETRKDESSRPGTTTAVTAGRMDIATVMRSFLEAGLQTTFLVCGPGSMADEATRQVVNCIKEGLRVDLIEEAFAW